LCYGAVVRTTLDIPDELCYRAKGAGIEMSDYGFSTFHCTRPVTTDDVRAREEEE